MHLKRQKVPKNWPIHRKGTAFVVRPSSNLKTGIPILIILRDMLKIAQNRKQAKKMIHEKGVLLNNKIARDEKNSAILFDVLKVGLKYYRLVLSDKGKFKLEEIKENESKYKVAKIINKKMLKEKKVQLNLSDGRNFLSDVECNTNDSVVVNLKDKKIVKCLELKEKSKVIVIGGKHAGAKGKIDKIDLKNKITEIIIKDKNKINVLIKHLIVVE